MGFIIKMFILIIFSPHPHFYLLPPLTLADPHSNCPHFHVFCMCASSQSLVRIASASCAGEPSLQEQGQLVSGCAAEAGDRSSGHCYSLQTSDLDEMEVWGGGWRQLGLREVSRLPAEVTVSGKSSYPDYYSMLPPTPRLSEGTVGFVVTF